MASKISSIDHNADDQRTQNDQVGDNFSNDTLLKLAMSRLGVERTAIVDIAPAGDFQSHAFFYAMLKSRGTDNYLCFTLPRGSDAERLRRAYCKVVEASQVHRTVFLPHDLQIFQVVLLPHHWTVDLSIEGDVVDCESAMQLWISQDLQKDPVQDVPVTRGAIFVNPSNGSINFVVQQPHCRNDAWSDYLFCQDLMAAYGYETVEPRPSYIDFTRYNMTLNRDKSMSYWSTLLAGSKPTEVVKHVRPTYTNIVDCTLEKTMLTPVLAGFTTAMILKAAFALVLARFTGERDITFGHLTSGRASNFEDIDKVSGPVLNIIPVRIDATNPDNILKAVHLQHIDSLDHEWMGERDIIRNCTDWECPGRFPTIVQMQNVEEVTNVTHKDGGDNNCWHVTLRPVDYDSADIWALAYPEQGEKMLRVTLCINEKVIPKSLGQEMLETLCDVMVALTESREGHERDRLVAFTQQERARLPVPGPAIDPPARSVSRDQVLVESVKDLVVRCWQSLWAANKKIVSTTRENVPFYRIVYEPWAAVQLTLGYRAAGYQIAVEDVLEHPTMHEQFRLLSSATCHDVVRQ